MLRRYAAAIATVALALDCGGLAAAAPIEPGGILVKYRVGATPARRAAIAARVPGAQRTHAFDFIRVELLSTPGISTAEALARVKEDPAVEFAEPNYVVTADVIPNDPSFGQLWALKNTGQGGAYAGDDIDATLAWDIYRGDPTLKVGIIDTGIDYTHPDLAANIWTNPGEIPGNGIDDEGNGYVDDVHGYDVVNGDGDPMDDHFHGTHVAGTVAAVADNGVGITGVLWHCQLVAIKFMDATGYGSEAGAIAAIEYSLAVGLRVTNNSWGNMPGGQLLLDAINAADAAGQLFVLAAGNNSWNIDMVPVYPPAFMTPNMITVAATDGRDLRASYSNFGAVTVQLGAPGSAIYSCKPAGLYQSLNGTSMAAPHVTGVAALAMGRFPHASARRIRQLILDSVEPIPSMLGRTSTGGRLNAYLTLLNGDATPPAAITDFAVADTGSTALGLTWTAPGDDGATGQASRYELRISSAPIDSANFDAATPVTVPSPGTAGTHESAEISGLLFSSTYYFALRAVDDFGNPGALSNSASVTTLGIPSLAAAPDTVGVTLSAGQTTDVLVTLSNVGLGRLDYAAGVSPGGGWLAVSPGAGRIATGASAPLTLHLDATGLADGMHDGILAVTSNDPAQGTADIPVRLTVDSQSGVVEPGVARTGLRLTSANPGRSVALELTPPAAGGTAVNVYDVRGACVRHLFEGSLTAGIHPLFWDARGERGARVAPGVYFVRAVASRATFVARVVLTD